MPTLTINLTLRKDTARELTFDQVDNNFVSLKNAIVAVNNDLSNYSPESHDHGMTGMVAHFAMQNPPAGWLVADGRAVSRTTYAKLFSAIGVAFGVGNGIDTFNLPDLRGEFIRGWDNGRGVDDGRTFGSWQKSSVSAYDPSGQDPGVGGICSTTGSGFLDPDANLKRDGFDILDLNLYKQLYITGLTAGSASIPGSGAKLNAGGWALGGSRPRNIALLPCIKF